MSWKWTEFLNSIPESDEISGINDKGDPGIMKFQNGGYFRRPTAAVDCRIFIEDGAKLRVVRVSNMQSGWWPFNSATIDVNYRDIVVLLLLPSLKLCGAIDIKKRDKKRQIRRKNIYPHKKGRTEKLLKTQKKVDNENWKKRKKHD